jgi:hypothetical protein
MQVMADVMDLDRREPTRLEPFDLGLSLGQLILYARALKWH